MLVNSITFLLFFVLFLIPYFSILRNRVQIQNIWVLIASYFFYGWADWRMLPLLLGATVVFYLLGKKIEHKEKSALQGKWLISFPRLVYNYVVRGIVQGLMPNSLRTWTYQHLLR